MNDQVVSRFGVAANVTVDGKYRLEKLLGAGGGGEVWQAAEAVDATAWRTIALKLVSVPDGLSGPKHTDWLHEVRAASQVLCDALPRVYTVGTTNLPDRPATPFIAMELLRGEALEGRISRGAIHWRKSLAIALRIAKALDACHLADVIHCDLKPRNVFLENVAPQRVLVLDFGIASANGVMAKAPTKGTRRSVEETDVQTTDAPATSNGPTQSTIMGTAGYISPERLAGRTPDHRDDAFSLGVVLFRMIAGRFPQRVSAAAVSNQPNRDDSYEIALHKATVERDFDSLTHVAPNTPRAVVELVDMLLGPAERRPAKGSLEKQLEDVYRRPHGRPPLPYMGLGAFDQRRTGYLPGRTADIESIAQRLQQQVCLVLGGASGTGKSSLAIAGVAAKLDEDMLLEKEGWELLVLRPSNASGRLSLSTDKPGQAKPIDPTLGLFVVVDQFEEVLTLPAKERIAFCEAFTALVERTATVFAADRKIGKLDGLRVIATIRDDLFGRVAALPELKRLPEQNLYMVRGVDPNAAREIVVGPLEGTDYSLEKADGVDIVADVAQELERNPSSLPLVQFALSRLWDLRDTKAHVLRAASWKEIGGIVGALGDAAQTLYEGFSLEERQTVRGLFLKLFDVDGTRIVVRESALDSAQRALTKRWTDEGILRRRQEDENNALIEPLHEALVKGWPQLRKWLDEVRSDRELIRDVQRDAKRWELHGKPADMLWRGTMLQPESILRSVQDEPTRAFVEASYEAANLALALAEQEKKRAFFVNRIVPATIGVIVLAVALGGWWVTSNAKIRVDAALADARVSEAKAKESAEEATREKLTAQLERQNAVHAEKKAKLAEKASATLRDQYLNDLTQLKEDIKKAKTVKQLEALRKRIDGKQTEDSPVVAQPASTTSPSVIETMPDPFR